HDRRAAVDLHRLAGLGRVLGPRRRIGDDGARNDVTLGHAFLNSAMMPSPNGSLLGYRAPPSSGLWPSELASLRPNSLLQHEWLPPGSWLELDRLVPRREV